MNHSVSTLTGKTKIKIVFLGNQSVGKSSIIQQYIHNRFQQASHPTVGIDFLAKNLMHKNKNYRLQLWDTAGQQRFRSLIPSYLRDSQCALIIFDVTNKDSFDAIEGWIKLYNENKTKGKIIIVGNKIDLTRDREVSLQEGLQRAQQMGICYFQISAKTGQNIENLFMNVIEICSNPNFDYSKINFQKQVETSPSKIDEVQQKNQDQKQKQEEVKEVVTPNFSQVKQKTLNEVKGVNSQQLSPVKKQEKSLKIRKTDSMILETSQKNDNKVIRLYQNKQKPQKDKGCC